MARGGARGAGRDRVVRAEGRRQARARLNEGAPASDEISYSEPSVPVMPTSLTFASRLRASPERVWAHATSMPGVNRELAPFLRMSYPADMASLSAAEG